jgi:isoleucyl-tRNA synthetase
MLVLDENGTRPLVDLQEKCKTGGLSGKYENEYYNEGEAPERSVDVEIAIS